MNTLKYIYDELLEQDPRCTDKGVGFNSHIGLYEDLLSSYRDKPIKLFEVGVNRGGSVKMWQRYFEKAQIYGLDIREKVIRRKQLDRISLLKVDQSSESELLNFGKKYGDFDIGIDDGSHVWKHQILTFECLWPHIRSGGLYVIEDVLTSYPNYKENRAARKGGKTITKYGNLQGEIDAVSYFQHLIDEINLYGKDDDISSLSYNQRSIEWILFRHNSIAIKKKYVTS